VSAIRGGWQSDEIRIGSIWFGWCCLVLHPQKRCRRRLIADVAKTLGATLRGIRNNNPGNIERNNIAWNGMSADQSGDDRYIIFDRPEYGIRAMGRVLNTYYTIHTLQTVRGIITRWGPRNQPDIIESYIKRVAQRMGIGSEIPIDWTIDNRVKLVAAIIKHENGVQPYSTEFIRQSVLMP